MVCVPQNKKKHFIQKYKNMIKLPDKKQTKAKKAEA